ncbi:VOC family protein [Catenulispora pinisilvae]|uniref:VOC family protein n=1 Tax=Catenulispora pinisilvae TaxID=2705253 RepID=UPI001891EE7C|nr:VOC family protein [Catenulispora pinisilvae]
MISFTSTQLWVHDQDAALDFYTTKIGFVVRSDVTVPEMGNFRWLSVGPAHQPDISIVLMAIPGEPIMDDATRAKVEELTGKGFAGTLFLTSEDVDADYATLVERGVEFIEKPSDQIYGRDSSFRDPSGNHIRLMTAREMG